MLIISSIQKIIRKKATIILLFASYMVQLGAQNAQNAEYVKRYSRVAMEEMQIYKIPASITLAQGILESANGKSELSRKSNNHFGIKCAKWNGAKVYHDDDRKGECFRKYDSPWESFRDHSKFLAEKKRYAPLFKLNITNYKKWAHGLKKAGYATDRKYPQRLIKLIEDNQLYKYDEMVVNNNIPKDVNPKEYAEAPHLKTKTVAGALVATEMIPGGKMYDPNIKAEIHIVKHHPNRLDYIVVSEGDTYESISKELNISVKKIFSYNDKSWDSPLVKGDYIYMGRKRTHGKKKYHKVEKGDTMYKISQKEGIRLEYLYKRNNIKFGTQPKVGDKLYLRAYKKKD